MEKARLKTPQERDTTDLLALVCELSARLSMYRSRRMHDFFWEARNELQKRIDKCEGDSLGLSSDVSQQRELLIADFIEKYNKGLVGNERIHEDCLKDYLQGKL